MTLYFLLFLGVCGRDRGGTRKAVLGEEEEGGRGFRFFYSTYGTQHVRVEPRASLYRQVPVLAGDGDEAARRRDAQACYPR